LYDTGGPLIVLFQSKVSGNNCKKKERNMPAYMVARVNVKDPVQYEEYKKLAPIAINKYGGEYLTRGGAMDTLEGEPETHRVVIVKFPDYETAQKFYDSPEYTRAKAERENAATGQFIILDGYQPA
jgi:uncharacterized protein (DUF1330 family)